jgi:hypothetical protein
VLVVLEGWRGKRAAQIYPSKFVRSTWKEIRYGWELLYRRRIVEDEKIGSRHFLVAVFILPSMPKQRLIEQTKDITTYTHRTIKDMSAISLLPASQSSRFPNTMATQYQSHRILSKPTLLAIRSMIRIPIPKEPNDHACYSSRKWLCSISSSWLHTTLYSHRS